MSISAVSKYERNWDEVEEKIIQTLLSLFHSHGTQTRNDDEDHHETPILGTLQLTAASRREAVAGVARSLCSNW